MDHEEREEMHAEGNEGGVKEELRLIGIREERTRCRPESSLEEGTSSGILPSLSG